MSTYLWVAMEDIPPINGTVAKRVFWNIPVELIGYTDAVDYVIKIKIA